MRPFSAGPGCARSPCGSAVGAGGGVLVCCGGCGLCPVAVLFPTVCPAAHFGPASPSGPLAAPASRVTLDALTGPRARTAMMKCGLRRPLTPATCVCFCLPLWCCGRCSQGAWLMAQSFLSLCCHVHRHPTTPSSLEWMRPQFLGPECVGLEPLPFMPVMHGAPQGGSSVESCPALPLHRCTANCTDSATAALH